MNGDLYFRYPILDFSYWRRLARRVGRNIFEIVLSVSAIVMLFSDVPDLILIGAVLFAYTIYSFGRRIFQSKPSNKFKGGNLADFTTKKSKKIILVAYDRSAFLGGSFLLHLTRELVELPIVIRVLKGLDVSRDEFVSKLEFYISDETNVKETNIWRQAKIEELMIAALVAQSDEKKPIQPFHLFLALPETQNERVQRLFNLFGLNPAKLEKAARYHNIINS
ncbi:hypothetical protein KKH05_00410 [Patescibacteria group bacterium]|nr:hypothetical protein [Patescibacteria group bacterium]